MNEIGLFVTAACNRSCRHCSQQPWMQDNPGYEMTLPELDRALARIEAVGGYDTLVLTGGEPLLWTHLAPALERIRCRGVPRKVTVNTNGSRSDHLAQLLRSGLVHSATPNNAGRHRPLPLRPVPGVLPARCGCPRHTIMRDCVYICGNLYSTSRRAGLALGAAVCPIDDDWPARFAAVDKYHMPVCAYCHSNRNIG